MRNEDLPQAAVEALAHLAAPPVPLVEIADDGDAARVRRPQREQHAADAFMGRDLRAEPLVELPMRALDQQMIVDRAQRGTEGVGVLVGFDAADAASPRCGRRDAPSTSGNSASKKSPLRRSSSPIGRPRGSSARTPDRVGHEGADRPACRRQMRPQNRKRILLARRRDGVDIFLPRSPRFGHFIIS